MFKACADFSPLACARGMKSNMYFELVKQRSAFAHHLGHSCGLVPVSCTVLNRA